MKTLEVIDQPNNETGNARFTNRENLPAPIVRAVTRDPYSKGKADFSVTELLQPPRARALIKEHRNEIVEDVSDKIWALCGQIGHAILERAGDSHIIERRFFAKIGDYTVSGQADLIIHDIEVAGETGTTAELTDYKFCSVWTTKDGVKPEWTQQANILRYLALNDDNPIDISKASIVAIFRDWSKPKAAREKDFPQSQIQVFQVQIWTHQETEKFIWDRIRSHQEAEHIELPLCTDDERWRTPEKWAVKKKGNKRADKLFDLRVNADDYAYDKNNGFPKDRYEVEHRAGESKRCEFYCLAAPFCEQFKKEKERQP